MRIERLLDLNIAWERLKLDHRDDRGFAPHPYILRLIEVEPNAWLESVRRKLESGYSPHDAYVCSVPKPGLMVRSATILHPEDELVYNAIIAFIYPSLWRILKDTQGNPDVASQLKRPMKGNSDWVRNWRDCNTRFRRMSFAMAGGSTKHVVFLDISNFYDNIDTKTLQSDLLEIGTENVIANLLLSCLNRWAMRRERGVPQGYTASDLLAKLYMADVDHALRNQGVRFVRYNDDIRIFCRNSVDAKRAILLVNDLLVKKSLNLQAAKTLVLESGAAREQILGAEPKIQKLQNELPKILRNTPSEPARRAAEKPPEVRDPQSRDKLELAYRLFRTGVEQDNRNWDQKLFRYLLTRLGAVRSLVAVTLALEQLVARPEETEYVLQYIAEVAPNTSNIKSVLKFSNSDEAVYDYQLYLIVRWFVQRNSYPKGLVRLCRDWAFDLNRITPLRCESRVVLMRAGEKTDWMKLQASYANVGSEMERAEIALAVSRMEKGVRNTFYGRIEADGDLVTRAVRLVKSSDASKL